MDPKLAKMTYCKNKERERHQEEKKNCDLKSRIKFAYIVVVPDMSVENQRNKSRKRNHVFSLSPERKQHTLTAACRSCR